MNYATSIQALLVFMLTVWPAQKIHESFSNASARADSTTLALTLSDTANVCPWRHFTKQRKAVMASARKS